MSKNRRTAANAINAEYTNVINTKKRANNLNKQPIIKQNVNMDIKPCKLYEIHETKQQYGEQKCCETIDHHIQHNRSDDIESIIEYISNNINDMDRDTRINIIDQLLPYVSKNNVYEKGCGIQIPYKYIPIIKIKQIYEYMIHKLEISK